MTLTDQELYDICYEWGSTNAADRPHMQRAMAKYESIKRSRGTHLELIAPPGFKFDTKSPLQLTKINPTSTSEYYHHLALRLTPIPPVEPRDLPGAAEWLKEGHAIRRPSWMFGYVLHKRDGMLQLEYLNPKGHPTQSSFLRPEDLQAQDWILADVEGLTK